VITKSLYQVLYQYVTDKVNNHQSVGKYMRNFTIYVIAIGVPVFVVLYWMLPALTECFLGGGWESTGLYIRWMLPWLLCSFLTSSTGFLSDVFSQQKVAFVFEVLTAVCRTIGVVTGLILKDFSVSVAGYALGSALAVLAQYVWLMTLVKKYDYQING
jgi:O-antigen/teichoic acid export membrane protein